MLKILGETKEEYLSILNKDALEFLVSLHRTFNSKRESLLGLRQKRWSELKRGKLLDFLPETEKIRSNTWRVAKIPSDLEKRHVEITGPVDAKMMINALNSGANCFMADFEDALSPTWENVIEGQIHLIRAVRKILKFISLEGKAYELKNEIATLIVRPRGWHLVEKNVWVNQKPISASLFDFGLYFFHNGKERLQRGTAPYFYLPKLESHLEARLWNDVFVFAEKFLGIPKGSIKVTVLIETIPAAFEMDEILYELRDHCVGLNAGRWDYIFSVIKKLGHRKDFLLPDRARITMDVPFMRAYADLLVKTCHRRGAHAMGGMSAFVPNRKDPLVNEKAFEEVQRDKIREVGQGFDGTWVAHPDLVPVAKAVFDKALGERPHQKDKLREDCQVTARELLNVKIPKASVADCAVTEEGIRNNISVALQYLEKWLKGTGAVVILNLMEDAATAEIARIQLWQWLKHRVEISSGKRFSKKIYETLRDEELEKINPSLNRKFEEVIQLIDSWVLGKKFFEFLTIPAYRFLNVVKDKRRSIHGRNLHRKFQGRRSQNVGKFLVF